MAMSEGLRNGLSGFRVRYSTSTSPYNSQDSERCEYSQRPIMTLNALGAFQPIGQTQLS